MIFSIIIPTLQEEKIIEKMLLSLRKLKDFEYEIIISDGGSSDKTVEIARKYADRVLVHNLKNGKTTIADGRNEGAKIAQGKYIVFLDADVFIPKSNEFFRKALEIFEKDDKLVAITVTLKVFPELETIGDKMVFGYMNFMHKLLNNYLKTPRAPGEFQMIKMSAFRKVGGFNASFTAGEDYDLSKRIGKVGKTHFEKDLLVYYTGRRAHKIGWPKLLWQWSMNSLSASFRKKEWKVIR